MRYSPEIEQRLIEQITREPKRPVVLPDWAYWEGTNQCYIAVDGLRTPLMRHLSALLGRPIPEWMGLRNPPDVDPRNVNPVIAVPTPRRQSDIFCPNGHRYQLEDFRGDDVGQQCQVCLKDRRERNRPAPKGTPSAIDLNREKTHCPQGHPLAGDNLIQLKSGKRRCRTCHAETQARYRAGKKAS